MALAQAGVRALTPYEPGKPIETLERELGIRDSLKLASNENPLGPSPLALAALSNRLRSISLYPDGAAFALRQALASKLGLKAATITVGNGSNEILELIARAFLGPGLNAVYSEHAFAVYSLVTQAVGADARIAPANPVDHPQPFGHDLAALRAQVNARTRVVFVANPNNPTGTWLDRQALQEFIANLPPTLIVVVDEAYCEYVREPQYPDASLWLCEYANLIITRTFSKIYGLAGLRIGYGLSSAPVAEILNRVRQPFNTNSLAQVAAIAALGDDAHLRKSRQTNAAGLDQLAGAFRQRGLGFIPSVGNFICFDCGGPALPIYQAMLRRGVIVRPVANYGLPNHLRCTVGTSVENARLLAAIDGALQS